MRANFPGNLNDGGAHHAITAAEMIVAPAASFLEMVRYYSVTLLTTALVVLLMPALLVLAVLAFILPRSFGSDYSSEELPRGLNR